MKEIQEWTDAELRACSNDDNGWDLAAEVLRLRAVVRDLELTAPLQQATIERAEKAEAERDEQIQMKCAAERKLHLAEAELATTNHATSMNWMHRAEKAEAEMVAMRERHNRCDNAAHRREAEVRAALAATRAEAQKWLSELIERDERLDALEADLAATRAEMAGDWTETIEALQRQGDRYRAERDVARAEKAEADLAAARAAGRDDAVELLACPKCGAAPGEPCTTGGYLPVGDLPGDARPEGPHKQRQVQRETPEPVVVCARCGCKFTPDPDGWCVMCLAYGPSKAKAHEGKAEVQRETPASNTCLNCGSNGHWTQQCQVQRETPVTCVRCGGEGPFNSQGWCQGCASPGYT